MGLYAVYELHSYKSDYVIHNTPTTDFERKLQLSIQFNGYLSLQGYETNKP